MRFKLAGWAVLIVMVVALDVSAQTPRVVRQSGVVRDGAGQPRAGAVTLTFGIYAEAEGGAPLWTEVQGVTLDSQGRYAVALGALAPEGLPLALFTSGEARWLGVAVDGGVELRRIALLSVPYALQAADAETVAGKPLSAFVLAGDTTGTGADGLTYMNPKLLQGAVAGVTPLASSGSPGYLGVFTNSTDLGNSIMFQSGTSIGVNTTAPLAAFHTMATAAPGAFFDVYSNALGALPVVYRAARGTPGAPTAVQTDDILGGLAVRGYGATGFSGGQGQVMFRAAEPWTDAAHGTYLQLTTTPLGSASWAERMRISPAGNVGIGTTSPSARLHVAGDLLFENKWRTETTTVNPGAVPGPPNLIGGFLGTGSGGATPGNRVTAGVVGATIGGGGFNGTVAFSTWTISGDASNRVTDGFGTVGGGFGNRAGNYDASGDNALWATVGGGRDNVASGEHAIVGGGYANRASGKLSTAGGGLSSIASGFEATVGGGHWNNATGEKATVGGGKENVASGFAATVPGGDFNTALGDYSFAAGRQAKAMHSGTFVWGDSTVADFASTGNDQFVIRASGGVGIGTNAPQQTLHVDGTEILSTGLQSGFKFRERGSTSIADDWVWYSSGNVARLWRHAAGEVLTVTGAGVVAINGLGAAGSTALCRNAVNEISTCSSSIRYKQNVSPFHQGLSLITHLRPVSFEWRANHQADVGLVAEEVNTVEPLLTFRNDNGEIEGVKYNQLSAVFINAFKEQQEQIQQQQELVTRQQDQTRQQSAVLRAQQEQLDALKTLVCGSQDIIAVLKAENTSLDARLRALELALKQSQARQ
jgi:hypothetical protein